jgi:hypothetical protein
MFGLIQSFSSRFDRRFTGSVLEEGLPDGVYFQPDGSSVYFQPDGSSLYLQP